MPVDWIWAALAGKRWQPDPFPTGLAEERFRAPLPWLEAGWPIQFVKEMLGHSNISQTDTYLNASAMGLQDAMRRFDDLRCTRVAQIPAKEHRPVCNEDPRDADKGLLH